MTKDIKIRGGLPFVVVQTMEGKDLRMLIDTGAEHSVISDGKYLANIKAGGESIGQSGVAIDVLEGLFSFVITDDLTIGA